jgi:hypothetical protein
MNSNDEKNIIGKINVSGGQVNIVGKGVINQFNTGSQESITQKDLIKLITKIEMMVKTQLPDGDIKNAVQGDLRAAAEQSQKQNPQSGLILNRLKSALDLIASLGSAVAAGQTISPLLQQAYEIAKAIFIK